MNAAGASGKGLDNAERKLARQLVIAYQSGGVSLSDADRALVLLSQADQIKRHIDGLTSAVRIVCRLAREDYERKKQTRRLPRQGPP